MVHGARTGPVDRRAGSRPAAARTRCGDERRRGRTRPSCQAQPSEPERRARMTMIWRPLGDTALRAARPDGIDAATLLATLRRRPGVVDVVVTDAWVAVTFTGAPPDLDG